MSELTERIERALFEAMRDIRPKYGPYDNYSALYREKASKLAPHIEAALRAAAAYGLDWHSKRIRLVMENPNCRQVNIEEINAAVKGGAMLGIEALEAGNENTG